MRLLLFPGSNEARFGQLADVREVERMLLVLSQREHEQAPLVVGRDPPNENLVPEQLRAVEIVADSEVGLEG
jgi:hypothetical protein